jgi:GNAT superfamily N-acetyltransferase
MSTTATGFVPAWPAQLRPGALRWARASSHYEDTIGFYRDVVGLPVIGEFEGSFGEDGTIFGLPGLATQMEIVRAHRGRQDRGSFDQLVLYLDDDEAVTAATAPLLERGLRPDPEPHAYWRANGAVSYRDPDGRALVFAPWVYGRDPDPVDRRDPAPSPPAADEHVDIREYAGERGAVRPLFELAEDSAARLDGYLDAGRVLLARRDGEPVGHLQLVPTDRAGEIELKNMAVVAELRGTGVGSALVATALARCRADRATRIVVATAAADVDNLRFYQRRGFRFTSVERDAFGPATGYPEPILVDGIPLRDRVWLAQDL